ncbi:MAG: 4-(cytidine 5'-diphospho)-2-C-methyl-D-erythritol kinase [Brumimicrobium sp.]
MISFPICKINLGLNITTKRKDGYHEIVSLMYPIEIQDILEVVSSSSFKFTCSGLEIPGDSSSNLCVKAFEILNSQYDLTPVHIHLYKNIPMGGGLGGGSADGAYTLMLLNEFFKLGISNDNLRNLAASLGSDCPFFIENKPQIASGRGEVLKPFDISLKGKILVLVNDGTHISTAEAYNGIRPKLPKNKFENVLKMSMEDWRFNLVNDFEETIFKAHPQLEKYKSLLYDSGAIYASMTGSGSTMFGIFDRKPDLPEELTKLNGFLKVVELK